MSKSTLTWYKPIAKQIMKGLDARKKTEIGIELNESRQVICYRMKNVYPELFEDVVRLIYLAGFEIVRHEDEED